MSPICPVRKWTITLARSGRDEWRTMELERLREREEVEKEENTQREAAGNQGREEMIQVAVAVEILRLREAGARPVTRDWEDGNLRKRDSEQTTATECLEASQNANIEKTDTTPSNNANTTT